MAALTAFRKRAKLDGPNFSPVRCPIKAAVVIYDGQMVGQDANGYLCPATTAIAPIGVANLSFASDKNVTGQTSDLGSFDFNKIDNTAGADGARSAMVEFGTFEMDNKAGDLVAVPTNLFKNISVEDDHTVRATAAGSVVAGKCMGIAENGAVFVAIGPGNQYARF